MKGSETEDLTEESIGWKPVALLLTEFCVSTRLDVLVKYQFGLTKRRSGEG